MNFTKMQATGNDFILIEDMGHPINWSKLAKDMCRYHYGIGADGLIVVSKNADNLFMKIYNPDGSEAEICGNGIRCFAKYVYDRGFFRNREIKIHTKSGIKQATVYIRNGLVDRVKVNMGLPVFEFEKIPLNMDILRKYSKVKHIQDHRNLISQNIKIGRHNFELFFVSMGNPHAIHFVKHNINKYTLHNIGPLIENHKLFPNRTNFEIAFIKDRKNIHARVWERGVGETLACGSGACAIGVVAIQMGLVEEEVNIWMPGGKLKITWENNNNVFLTGEVKEVFTGTWR